MTRHDETNYPWHAALRYRLVRAAKDTLGLLDRRTRISRISDSLYLGGKLTRSRIAYLERTKVSAIVSLQEERLDPMLNLDAHFWLPSNDGRPPDVRQLLLGARFMIHQMEIGRKVYVHCHAGVGRAPTLCAVFLVMSGVPVHEAIDRVRKARPWVRMNRRQIDAIHSCVRAFERQQGALSPTQTHAGGRQS